MLSPLGADAVGAYSVPSRVMLLDMIVALALGPVVSVIMAKANQTGEQEKVINNVLSLGLFFGIFLALCGLLIYPQIVEYLVADNEVASLSQQAVFYLTLAIPIRLMLFLGFMLIHGDGRGKAIMPLVFITIVLNGVLNWLFIYQMEFGFKGCYSATIITSMVELLIVLYLLSRSGSRLLMLGIPDKHWVLDILRKGGAEWGRLVSYQVVSLVLLALFAMDHGQAVQLEIFTLSTELMALLFMPMIAAMRSTAIILASLPQLQSQSQIFRSLRHVAISGLSITFIFGLLILIAEDQVWSRLYGISSTAFVWWHPFLVVLAVTMPINYVNSLQRGVWQSRERYAFLFFVDFIVQWFILLPCVFVGIYFGNAWLTWMGWLIAEVSIAIVFFIGRRDVDVKKISDVQNDSLIMSRPVKAPSG
jgi:Na+-driven multidrug efflux pump